MEFSTHKPSIRYEVQEILGRGSFAEVFRALRIDVGLGLQQVVALKVLNSAELIEEWKAEFSSLLRVKSKHCVQVFGFESWNGRPALVLELVEGQTLKQLHTQLDKDEITEILRQIQVGLGDLRACDLFHGDLSVTNVMVDRRGLVRLLDFGFANRGRRIAATLEFAAPELIEMKQDPFLADQYSLARIEQFLRQKELTPQQLIFCHNLTEDPSHRKPAFILFNEAAQMSLARKVQSNLIAQKNQRHQMNTIELTTPLSGRFSFRRAWAYVFALFIFCAVVPKTDAMKGFASRLHSETSATLVVRTRKWVRLEINGLDMGYGPLSVRLPVGIVNIHWRMAKGRGQRALTLSEGQNTVLDDAFFR